MVDLGKSRWIAEVLCLGTGFCCPELSDRVLMRFPLAQTIKKCIIGIVFFISALIIISPFKVHAENASVVFGSGQYEVEPGTSFRVGVYIKSDFGAASYNVIIRYDTAHLMYVEGADGADIQNGTLQLVGQGANTSIRRTLTFETRGTGNGGIYAEAAEVTYVPAVEALDEAGNVVIVPSGDPILYNITSLASAPVIISDNSQDDTTDPTDDPADDEPADTEVVDEPEVTEPVIPEPATEPEEPVVTEEPSDTPAPAEEIDETEYTVIPSVYPENPDADKEESIIYNPVFIVVVFAVFIALWIFIIITVSRKGEAARRHKEEMKREEEEREYDGGLKFADIDEDDDVEYVSVNVSSYKYKTSPDEESNTEPLNYADVDDMLRDLSEEEADDL